MKRASLVLFVPLWLVAVPALADRQKPADRPAPTYRARPEAVARRAPHPAPRTPRTSRLASRTDGFVAAPMPDPDIGTPPVPEDRRAKLAPTLFRLTNDFRGDGYPYGSSPQGMDDKKSLTVPGVKFSLPIQ
jgi:hypothetical protein